MAVATVHQQHCHDHGSLIAGGWRNKSENPGSPDQATRLIICGPPTYDRSLGHSRSPGGK